jgi:hypothetical protein
MSSLYQLLFGHANQVEVNPGFGHFVLYLLTELFRGSGRIVTWKEKPAIKFDLVRLLDPPSQYKTYYSRLPKAF